MTRLCWEECLICGYHCLFCCRSPGSSMCQPMRVLFTAAFLDRVNQFHTWRQGNMRLCTYTCLRPEEPSLFQAIAVSEVALTLFRDYSLLAACPICSCSFVLKPGQNKNIRWFSFSLFCRFHCARHSLTLSFSSNWLKLVSFFGNSGWRWGGGIWGT